MDGAASLSVERAAGRPGDERRGNGGQKQTAKNEKKKARGSTGFSHRVIFWLRPKET